MGFSSSGAPRYGRFLLLIAGVGGLLYGIDVGVIAAALLYLSKTIDLTVAQTSIVVAAVLGGSMVSSLVAGVLADLFGRKTMIIVSGVTFVASVGLIVLSQAFVPLFCGRLLQGMSGGVIAVVVPLYLAECLSAETRGRGTAIFQFMLTVGIAGASLTGWYYTRQAENAIAFAAGNQDLIRAIESHAWRGMFLAVIYPGLVFLLGSFFLAESPRWLFRRGRTAEAKAALLRSTSAAEAEREMEEMRLLAAGRQKAAGAKGKDSLLRRKYVLPFLLACLILSLNQATGINSILGYLVLILKQAGLGARSATLGDVTVKVLNCAMTVVAVALVDRKGRRFLLRVGTAGVLLALAAGGLLFHVVESHRIDVRPLLQAQIRQGPRGETLTLPVSPSTFPAVPATAVAGAAEGPRPGPVELTVLYSYGDGEKLASVLSSDADPVLRLAPEKETGKHLVHLVLERARYGPAPPKTTGWLIAGSLTVFIAFFALGPGVVVWLALSELMPTRIRSIGMGVALLLNQGVSTLIAALFLPVAGNYGYAAMFFFWAACTLIYFLAATYWLPETKGKTLEEIEQHFEGRAANGVESSA
ncbi:MAG TPA: MFS transporter [Acidobacteriaceae bacterium]|jgi:MFS family permease|nr:MFS transporter [Acidobacteriaceae bacterium]